MSQLDNLLTPQANELGSTGYTFVDADTLRDTEGNRFRIQGVNAPETAHYSKQDQQLKLGEAGGQMTTEQVFKLANDMGYTNVVKTGQMDETGSREVIDLQDKAGRSFRRQLAKHGVVDVSGRHDTADLQASADYHRLLRSQEGYEANEWDQAAAMVDEAIADESTYGGYFKQQQLIAGDARFDSAYNRANAAFTYSDRKIDTAKSLNPMSDAWDTGLIGVQEAMWGVTEMLGVSTGYDALANIGTAGVNRARSRISDRGHFIMDYKDVNGFGDAMEYVGNMAALSLPYMGISAAGAVAAPFTGGLSLSAPAAVYAGQTWNEMEGEKSASIAVASGVAQAALDRLGLSFLVKPGKASKQLLKEATEELVRKGATKEVAEQQVMQATRVELAGLAGDAAQVAANQLSAKNLAKSALSRVGVGGVGEAGTEAMQELTAYAGAIIGSDKTWDWHDANDRMINAVIAGGALGTAFSVPSTLYDAGAWADVAVRQAPAQAERLSQAGKYAEEERLTHGRVMSNEENAARARAAGMAAGVNAFPSLNERAEADKASRRERTLGEAIFDTVTAAPALWRGATRSIFTPDILAQSRSARVMADMFGGGLQRTFSGSTYENAKHHAVAIYKNLVATPDQVFSSFNDGRKTSRKQREAISDEVYTKLRAAINEDGVFDPSLVPDTDPDKPKLLQLQKELQRLSDKMYDDQKQYNPDLGRLNNYLLRYKAFNKKAIHQNKPHFVRLLMDEFNMPEKDAKEIADSIADSSEIDDISDALTAHGAAGHPGSHKQRTLDLAENPKFAEFMQKDLFANINSAVKSAARYTAFEQYIGKDHVVLNQLFKQMEAEGVPPEQINRMAKQMKDYLDAESGNYKRPTSEAGKRLQNVQRSFMMITTLAGLPLATVSSFVELALTMRGLTKGQIFGDGKKPGGLYHLGNELGKTMWAGAQETAAFATSKQVMPAATQGKEMLQQLGYYEWDVGAATVTGVTEIKPWQQDIYSSFFKWTGLQGWTNYTRAIRAAIAGDYITDKLNIILEATENTNEVQEARESLRNIGVNVDDMLAAYQGNGMFDPAATDILEQNFREGTFNFVNDAVALPQSGNRPLIYQDPRFALFTQFQGFIATFTANHIPKLWGEYVKRGTPAMKYNAFAIMTTMIMLGFASQYLKDLIKYGELRKFGADDHPYLSKSEYFQRGIRASGLLGTGERILDQFFPLYDQRTEGAGEWLYYDVLTGESPALGFLHRGGKGIGHFIEGDVGRGAKEATRFIPVAGVLNFVRDAVEDTAGEWNFKGN